METVNPTQVDFFEKKIEELEAARARFVTRIRDSIGSPRVNQMYLVSFDDEIRRARRSLAWVTGDES